jgi:hypothetical protein
VVNANLKAGYRILLAVKQTLGKEFLGIVMVVTVTNPDFSGLLYVIVEEV